MGTGMEEYAGIGESLKRSSVCIVDETRKITRETKVGSEPEALMVWFGGQDVAVGRIGLEPVCKS
jgi:hypothetical protein